MKLKLLILITMLGSCAVSYPEFETLRQCPDAEPGREAIKLTWLGVAGVFVDDGSTGLLIDPFVSRGVAPVSRVGGGGILYPEIGKIRGQVKALGATPIPAILVTHSHYDHAMDVPDFARETGAMVYGSQTTRQIMLGNELPDSQVEVVDPGTVHMFDEFKVEFLPAAHAGHLGRIVIWDGKLRDDPHGRSTYPGPASAYPMGQVYMLRITHKLGTILYYGSAGWIVPEEGEDNDTAEEEAKLPIPGDVVSIMALGGRFDSKGYVHEAVSQPGTDIVVPTHIDNLFALPRRPIELLDRAGTRDFIQVLTEKEPGVKFMPIPRGAACAVLPLNAT